MTHILDLSVVVPVYNEEAHLEDLVGRCLAVLRATGRTFELVLVNDGSADRSAEMIEEAAHFHEEVVGVMLNRNYGQHAAVMAGFAHHRGRLVVTLDADLQNPPEEIPRVLAELDKGHDVVGTVRRTREDSLFRRMASRTINRLIARGTGVAMRDYGCMLRGYHSEVVRAMIACAEKTTFIPILANSFAASPSEIEVAHASRDAGDSKYSLLKLIALQFDAVTSMTTFPLHVLVLLGAVLAGVGVTLGTILLVGRIVMGAAWAADGVFTLFSAVFVLMGGQFFALGILGEYLGRIFVQVRGRPMYFVHHVVGQEAQDPQAQSQTVSGSMS